MSWSLAFSYEVLNTALGKDSIANDSGRLAMQLETVTAVNSQQKDFHVSFFHPSMSRVLQCY